MAVELIDVTEGVVSLKIAGTLTEDDRLEAHRKTANIIQDLGNVRILIDATELRNWELGLTWDDDVFMRNDAHIEKMAFVGDRKWEDLVLIFGNKGLRDFPIEYFDPSEAEQARDWLAT